MGWPGPRRAPYTFRLADDEVRPLLDLARALPPMRNGNPNLSAAIRQIIAEWAAGKGRRTDLHRPNYPEKEQQ
jgi:hypothetical protein